MSRTNASRRILFAAVLAALAAGLAPPFAVAATVAPFHLSAGVLPPFASASEPGAPGALVELVQQIAAQVHADVDVKFYPWQRAVILPLNASRTVVLPLTRTPEREAKYRWLVKLYQQNFVFIARAGTELNLRSTASLKDKRVAVLRGSPHLKYLKELGFSQVFEASTSEELQRMLFRGIADAAYGSEVIHRTTLRQQGGDDKSLIYSPTVTSGEIWLGGSFDFSDAEALEMQRAMDALKANGMLAKILKKYGLGE